MSEWKKVKLGDLTSKITKGTTPSNIGESFCNRGVPFIRSELITQNKYISDEGILYISNQTHEKLKRSQLEVNDILFSMAGVYLGKTAILRECDVPANTNQAVAIIRLDSALCSVDFVYYYLNKESVIRYVNQISGQAAQPNINLQQIGEIPIVLPSRKEQHRIAAILSRYDSLIENYQKQIKLLEEAAQRLYKEWFVDLHFPGHENTKIVDGVPEGWEKKMIGEVCDTTSGGTPSRSKTEFYTGNIPWVKTKELNDDFIFDTEERITDDAIRKSSAKLIPSGSILMAMYGATIGKLAIAGCKLTTNQACCACTPFIGIYNWYLFYYLMASKGSLIELGAGGAQPNISREKITQFLFALPPYNEQKRIVSKIETVFQSLN